MDKTFFFYDLETSGLDARADRIMQFAGQRTDLELNPVGEPVNLLVKLCDDTLPSPFAIAVTGITPQQTQADGMSEAEFCKFLMSEVFVPGTIATGYNSVRFDDEFMRHLWWRNFYDAYEWQWKDGRSRWDLLDVVRMTRALRPEGINWPVDKDGKATNRLELLTKLNGISHEAAHDALSDVTALIEVTRMIRERQPKLYEYLLEMRDKKAVGRLVSLKNPQPFVYTSGRLAAEYNKTSVFYPLAPGANGNVLVFDLRYDVAELMEDAEMRERNYFPAVKTLQYNRCPAVAPLGVLAAEDGWGKIGLSAEKVQANLAVLLKHPEFAREMQTLAEARPEWGPAVDVESALYDGFLDHADRVRCNAVVRASLDDLQNFVPEFFDERLGDLLVHYKARNFPEILSEAERGAWEEYRAARLERQLPGFEKDLLAVAGRGGNEFVVEELRLWAGGILD